MAAKNSLISYFKGVSPISFRSISILCQLLLTSLGIEAQNFNRIHPPHLFDYEFEILDSSDTGNFLFTSFRLLAPGEIKGMAAPIIIDHSGYVLWYGNDTLPSNFSDFKYFPAQDKYLYMAYLPNAESLGYTLNSEMQVLDSMYTFSGTSLDQHEMLIRPDGSRVLVEVSDSIFDLSAYQFNGNPGSATTNCRCYLLQEIDTLDQLLWEWNSCKHLHPSLGYDFYGYNVNRFNYAHLNAFEIDANGDYLISFRHLNAIVKVNHQTGNVDWILGGKANQFMFTNFAPFTAQHHVRQLTNGNISLFDNANMSVNTNSRAIQFQLDTTNWTATQVFEYLPNPVFHAQAMGSYQVTDTVQFINYGYVNRPWPSAELIDANGQVLKRLTFEDSVMSYRGILYRPNTPFPRPEIRCIEDQGVYYLEAPIGFAKYLWSDGQTTQRIVAQSNMQYQVWVDYGIGMLGSLPYNTTAPLPCIPVAVSETLEDRVPALKSIGVFDLLGRKVDAQKANTVYIERFSNGQSRRVMVVE